ncbi:DedA family protein [Actinokineospora sp. 24-640]
MSYAPPAEPIGGMAGWAVDLMEALGGPGAALIVGLENLFPPLPSEIILPLAGFTAGQGRFSLLAAVLWTTAGSVLGALIVYLVGARLGPERTRALVAKIPLLKVSDFDRSAAWFDRHGGKAVFFGRMVPVFRSAISLPAGVERMNVAKFLLLTTLGSLVWNTAFVMAGYLLGANWHLVSDYAGVFQTVVFVALGVALVWFVVSRLRQRHRADSDQR